MFDNQKYNISGIRLNHESLNLLLDKYLSI